MRYGRTRIPAAGSLIIILFLFPLVQQLTAQQYRSFHYGVEQGLPGDLTKAVDQDSLGFIWIATDDGLVRFNGTTFTSYQDEIPSPFVKNFLHRKDGTFLAITDLGIVAIHSRPDTVTFSTVLPGSEELTDSTVWYPKGMYEDSNGTLWISEPTAVVRFQDGGLKRYFFPEKDHSFNFLRSFQFIETKPGNLFLFSLPGSLYFYNAVADAFTEVSLSVSISTVYAVCRINDFSFFAGTSNGLFRIDLNNDNTLKSMICVNEELDVSDLYCDVNALYIGCWTAGLHKAEWKGNSLSFSEIRDDIRVNMLFFDRDNDIWVNTDIGLELLQQRYTEIHSTPRLNAFSHNITETESGALYITDSRQVSALSVDKQGNISEHLFIDSDGYILYGAANGKGLWFGDSRGNIIHRPNEGSDLVIDAGMGNFRPVFYVMADSKNSVWAILQNSSGVLRIDENFELHYYDDSKGLYGRIDVIAENKDGTIYAGGSSPKNLLYKYNSTEDIFNIVTTAGSPDLSESILVNDIAFDNKKGLYLATTEGLLYYENDTVSRVDLQQYSDENIRAVAVSSDNQIWLGTRLGILSYNGDIVINYSSTDGIPSNTISYRSILIDSKERVWFGTSKGPCYMKGFSALQETPAPILLSIETDDKQIPLTVESYSFTQGAIIDIYFTSLIYPGEQVVYQTRIPEENNIWSIVEMNNHKIFAVRNTGAFTLQIRAKQKGAFAWSEPLSITYEVNPPWYSSWWAMVIYLIAILLIIFVIVQLQSRKLQREKHLLSKLVDERTKELKTKNDEITRQRDELEELNATKDKFFSIIGHDLKSPFTAMVGYSEILAEEYDELGSDQRKLFIDRLYKSSQRINELLENLLYWSRTQTGKIEVKKNRIDLTKLIFGIIDLFSANAEKKNIELQYNAPNTIVVYADPFMVKTVLRNLISNAVKFTVENGKVEVVVIRKDDKALIEVIDSGIGIEEERAQRLFTMKVSKSTLGTAKEKGTGLGLLLCKEFVELNDGTIGVVSKLNEGSNFSFTLPLADNES